MAGKGKDKESTKGKESKADESSAEGEKSAEPSKGSSKKKFLIIGVAVLLLIALAIAGTMFALNMLSGAENEIADMEAVDHGQTERKNEKREPAVYYPLDPPFIVNFQSRGRQRFLQVEVTLLMRDDKTVKAIESNMPMIRNSLILLFSGQVFEDLQTPEGRESLRAQALAEMQKLLEQEIGKAGVEQLLFTEFVMQ
jgi:flagellar protein FliL